MSMDNSLFLRTHHIRLATASVAAIDLDFQDDDWHFYSSALKDEREHANFSLQELSSETKIPVSILNVYEEGTTPISKFLLGEICEAYGKSINQFLLDNDLYDNIISPCRNTGAAKPCHMKTSTGIDIVAPSVELRMQINKRNRTPSDRHNGRQT